MCTNKDCVDDTLEKYFPEIYIRLLSIRTNVVDYKPRVKFATEILKSQVSETIEMFDYSLRLLYLLKRGKKFHAEMNLLEA